MADAKTTRRRPTGKPAWNRTHGCEPRGLYTVWRRMRDRCRNPNDADYPGWGGRGIKVTPEWDRFETFRDWALANGWRPGLWIDRVDNDGDYEPGNCRFATPKENNNHTRRSRYLTWQGRTMTVSQWADELGVPAKRLYLRVWRGWSVERILAQPILGVGRHLARRRPG